MRILVTRTDRLGDVILATPVLRKLKELNPSSKISFLVQPQWMPILQYGNEIEVIPYDPNGHEGTLVEGLRSQAFDVAYVLKDDARVSRAVKSAGIPVRIGPYSSFRSFFQFNEGKWQRRSQCRMHEAEYNLDLLTPHTPASSPDELPSAWIQTADSANIRAREFLARHRLPSKGFIVIHPGSSGSSRYVKPAKLHYLAQRLGQRGHRVLVSGGPLEADLLSEFKAAVPEVVLLGSGAGLELDGMAEVYRHSRLVIAHGTGPLHLGAAVATPVLAIFPPIFVLSSRRWGPLTSRRSIWVPAVPCPEKYRCRGERCAHFDCMDLFDVENALRAVEALIL
jgi:ADP-heptose:LPS heptosyltransferase